MRITPLGDSALTVRLADALADDPRQTLRVVLGALDRIGAAQLPGVIELAPAYTTVSVFFDPLIVSGAEVGAAVARLFQESRESEAEATRAAELAPASRLLEIPVVYGGEMGPDLDAVAAHAGLTPEAVIERHTRAEYQVHFLGFTPGFPYLSGLPAGLATPRRAVPRKVVPAGSVGIGGTQTGVYPVESPGGWQVIGRTSLALFSLHHNPPVLLRAGDRVRFVRVEPGEGGR
jgi:inhibitor of KinA